MTGMKKKKKSLNTSRIQVQIWNGGYLLLDFSFFFCKSARLYTSTFGGRRLCGTEKVTRVTSRMETRRESLSGSPGRKGKGEMSAASAAIPARDLTFTVTQGNQLRNKLSFYRILNRVLPSGRDVEI